MKYISVLFLSMAIFMFGCTDKEKITKLEEQNAQLTAQYEELSEETEMKDQFIEEYTKTINEVYSNLENIRKRESLISKYSEDMEKSRNASLRDRMMDNISSIETYLASSKKKLKNLKDQSYNSQLKATSLEENIDKLTSILEEKETQIAELKTQMEELNVRVASAESELLEKNQVIEDQTKQLHTVYYIVGTEKDLKEKGIIEEKGGILGIRQTKKLTDTFSKEYFTSGDMTEMGALDIQEKADDVKIISPHNPESYQLMKKDEESSVLEIIQPDEFWKTNYLVVLTKG